MKRYWRDYVEHMLRTYCRHKLAEVKGTAEQENWQAVDRAFRTFSARDAEMMLFVYSSEAGVDEALIDWSVFHQVPIMECWRTLHTLIKRIAAERGLL